MSIHIHARQQAHGAKAIAIAQQIRLKGAIERDGQGIEEEEREDIYYQKAIDRINISRMKSTDIYTLSPLKELEGFQGTSVHWEIAGIEWQFKTLAALRVEK